MQKEIFNIIGFSADPIINAAFKSLITAIKCKPIIINDYDVSYQVAQLYVG